ncbi:MAG TPA: type II toxin-antitoxin system VapC family toxin [Asticcacaulis sp.]|nr:type II toxin-antitoxin system VapC family toxin [Asticcacaulis sp.]
MSAVLDASALLAMLLYEPGRETVLAALKGAAVSAVNMSEVYAKIAEKGLDMEAARKAFSTLPFEVTPFDEAHAFLAGQLRVATRAYGLSFGDRACLATAMLAKRAVLTADRAWLRLDLGIDIVAIR